MKFPKYLILLIIVFSSCRGVPQYYLPGERTRVKTGLEVFLKKYADDYRDKTAILITNHSGVDIYMRDNISLLREKGITVTMVMAPEHGIYGFQNVYDKKTWFTNEKRRLIIYNLHKIDKKQLRYLARRSDLVLFDIQDMGMRCYTYISNLKFVMDSMKGLATELIVLDRPNPVAFLGTDGAYLEKKFTSPFVSAFPAPFMYNMTLAEAARYYRKEFKVKVNLKTVEMRGYYRNMYYHETGLPWVPPSPNLPTYKSAIIYTAVVLMEGINISLGRGTTKPFEYIGAPWIDPETFCRDLRKLKLKHFIFRPVYFKPTFSKYQGQVCGGAQIFYTGGKFSPTEVSYRLTSHIINKYPRAKWSRFKKWYDVDYLAGTDRFRKLITAQKPWKDYKKYIKKKVKKYKKKRRRYTIY